MKFSCLPVSLYAEISAGSRTLADWFRFAAELGLDGADISVAHLPDRTPAALDAIRQQADAAGVDIPVMVTYTDFTHPDAAERKRQISSLRRTIDAAARLGVSVLRVTAGQAHAGVGRDEGIGWAVEGLTACLDHADDARITLAYENHTIGYGWTQYDFSQPAAIFLEIVRRTEDSGLKILFDTANPLVLNDDPLAMLAAVDHRLAVLHVSDIRQTGSFEPVVIGTGSSPLRAIFEHLHAVNYKGWISVEEGSKTGEAGFRQAIPYMMALWADVSSQAR